MNKLRFICIIILHVYVYILGYKSLACLGPRDVAEVSGVGAAAVLLHYGHHGPGKNMHSYMQ